MTVYVLSTGDYDDYRIQAIFSTRQKADMAQAEWRKSEDTAKVEQYGVDDTCGFVSNLVYCVQIGLAKGSLRESWTYQSEPYFPESVPPSTIEFQTCVGRSIISYEDALLNANKLRNEWLETRPLLTAEEKLEIGRID